MTVLVWKTGGNGLLLGFFTSTRSDVKTIKDTSG